MRVLMFLLLRVLIYFAADLRLLSRLPVCSGLVFRLGGTFTMTGYANLS